MDVVCMRWNAAKGHISQRPLPAVLSCPVFMGNNPQQPTTAVSSRKANAWHLYS
jgi:hypothetical protein